MMSVSTTLRKKKKCPSHTNLNQIGPYFPNMLACSLLPRSLLLVPRNLQLPFVYAKFSSCKGPYWPYSSDISVRFMKRG